MQFVTVLRSLLALCGRIWARKPKPPSEHDDAKDTAKRVLADIVDLMKRYQAAERSPTQDEDQIYLEIIERPVHVEIPGESPPYGPDPDDSDQETSDADDLDSVLLLFGFGAPHIRVVLPPTCDAELQYAYRYAPWTALSVPARKQRYLDDFAVQFAWMRDEFGSPVATSPTRERTEPHEDASCSS